MNIIAKKAVLFYIDKYPTARLPFLAWYNEFVRQKFKSFNELKAIYGSASLIANGRIIFNIKGNDFRLLISINFKQTAAYIIWFGTHKEYNNINAQTIKFDTKILNYKV